MKHSPFAKALQALFAAVSMLLGAAPALRAEPLRMTFVNQNTTYPATNAWILFSYTGTSADQFVGTVLGSGPKSGAITFSAGAGPSAGSYFSEVYRITDLADGVDIAEAPSTRIYVSLGQALDPDPASGTPSNPFSGFGAPSPTATSDPNWLIRWDFFETTLSNPRSANDYGDISAINQLAIPLQIELFKSATELTQPNLLQSARTAPNPRLVRQRLTALADANLVNNNFASFPGNWYVETAPGPATESNPFPATFLRQVGPASGGTTPEWIGPFPSMNDYATFVANAPGTPISTALTDTTSVAAIQQQTYDMSTTAALSETSELLGIKVSGTVQTQTWDAVSSTWNPATTDGKTYEMRIALDTNVGQVSGSNYSLSNAFYGSAWKGNSGVSYWITDQAVTTAVTETAFLASVSSNSTMALQTVNQWMQNAFVGYNFGLVGNTRTVSNLPPSASHLSGKTLNEMGSAGWADLKTLIDQGQLSTGDVPFFTLTNSQGRPLYNQWAKIVFDESLTAYGTQYSDMFQPLLALYSYQSHFLNNVYGATVHDVLAWKVTILPDVAPEPAAAAGAALAFGTLAALSRWRARRR